MDSCAESSLGKSFNFKAWWIEEVSQMNLPDHFATYVP